MQKSQVNRAVVAARCNMLHRPVRPTTVATNPAMRTDKVEPGGNIGRQWPAWNRGGSGDKGYLSEWSRSTDAPYGGWR